jgi:ubiquinone/menaquinone biosynthesis C-methylase UbiE
MPLTFEYLDPEKILDGEDFRFVENFLKASRRTQIGWHYLIDLTWIYTCFKDRSPGLRVLDAGGGTGPTQFLLAELGHKVTNIDLLHRPPAPWQYRRYDMTITTLSSYRTTGYVNHLQSLGGKGVVARARDLVTRHPWIRSLRSPRAIARHDAWRQTVALGETPIGNIDLVTGNLSALPELESGQFDAVVSLSALEHIPTDALRPSVAELKRLLKPEAIWAVTTSGTERSKTWWHEPSRGFCFSETDLANLFDASAGEQMHPKEILKKYKNNVYLRNHLASFYRKSGNNGMPWGQWNPTYIPCGISGGYDDLEEHRALHDQS